MTTWRQITESDTPSRWSKWFAIRRRWKFRCCDCSLVHDVRFRIIGGQLQMSARVDNRATAACRREANKRTRQVGQARVRTRG